MSSRRQFISMVPAASAVLFAGRPAFSADAPMVDEKDAQAAALGYVADATKANKAKFATYAAGQMCGTCSLYQGKAGAAAGPCPLFPLKQVASKGWCSAYAKKAA